MPKGADLLLFALAANPRAGVGMETPMAKCPPEAREAGAVLSPLPHGDGPVLFLPGESQAESVVHV